MIISSGLLADVSDLPLELLVDMYDNVLHDTMDILAPVKPRTIVSRPNAPWDNEDIGNEKRKRCRLEHKGHSSSFESNRVSYIEQCSVLKTMLYKAKESYYLSHIQDNAHNTRLLFRSIEKLLQRQTEQHYPSPDNDQQFANAFAYFFTSKIERIREELVLWKRIAICPCLGIQSGNQSVAVDGIDARESKDCLVAAAIEETEWCL